MVKRAKPAGWHGESRQSLPRNGQEPETAEHKTRRDHRQPVLPIDQIIVGDRTRRDLGDIAGLDTRIAKIGLLNPITVDENGRLLAGARGLAACKRRERPLRGRR